MTLKERSEGSGKEGMLDILRFSWNKVHSLVTFRIYKGWANMNYNLFIVQKCRAVH